MPTLIAFLIPPALFSYMACEWLRKRMGERTFYFSIALWVVFWGVVLVLAYKNGLLGPF